MQLRTNGQFEEGSDSNLVFRTRVSKHQSTRRRRFGRSVAKETSAALPESNAQER